MIAALYVAPGGVYYDLPDVEPWGLPEKDAREYAGPYPVVAHPPCQRWSMLAAVVEARYGIKRGEDGGLFEATLATVRRWGGVLEHPAQSKAWDKYNLNKPQRSGGWVNADFQGGWTCCIEQGNYGHRARKATWLYVIGCDSLPSLKWGKSSAIAWVSHCEYDTYPHVERLSKKEAAATPLEFRDLLLDIARGCKAQ